MIHIYCPEDIIKKNIYCTCIKEKQNVAGQPSDCIRTEAIKNI